MIGPQYGISWIDNFTPTDAIEPPPPRADGPSLMEGLQPGVVVLQPGDHPFPTRYARWSQTIRIEPSMYLDALVREFLLWGGRIVIRKFDTPRELAALGEPVVVNCTGLGSRELFGDRELVPLKGQLTVLVPQPDVNYHTTGGTQPPSPGSLGLHMMPRGDGIVLGGTSQRDTWTLEPDEAERKRVVDGHIELFTRMRRPA
jgi:glycine/D-amino acid oxidase-like deaminating enzyme